jgi:hypothetical protein
MGKNVKLTPKNITKNWIFNKMGFIVNPVIKENQFTNPPIKPNTAPILNT